MLQYDSYLKFEAARKRLKRSKGKGRFFFTQRSEEESFSFDNSTSCDEDTALTRTNESQEECHSEYESSQYTDSQETSDTDNEISSQSNDIVHSTPNKDPTGQLHQFTTELLSPVYGTSSRRLEANLQRMQAKRKLQIDAPLQEPKKPNLKLADCVCNEIVCICVS